MSTIKNAIQDLFDLKITVDEAIERHFSPAFRQRTNGTWEDRTAVASRIGESRALVESVVITVLDELIDGTRYADRHIIELHRRDGTRLRMEVYVFAERDADERFARIEETTLVLGER